jgi:hypothetical protein
VEQFGWPPGLGFLHLVTHGELHGDLTPAGEQLSLGFNLGARLLAAVALLMYAAMPAVPDVPRFRKRLAIGIVLAWVLIPGYLVLTYPVLLDVDNGPAAFTSSDNAWLYSDEGLSAIRSALKPGGTLAILSLIHI